MNDGGFTLPEMLVALMLAGIAMGAVAAGAHITSVAGGRLQTLHATSLALTRFEGLAGAALRDAGPFSTEVAATRLSGDGRQAVFDCGQRQCSLDFAVGSLGFTEGSEGRRAFATPVLSQLRLGYISALDGREQDRWPPADRSDRLAALVVEDGGRPVTVLAVGREQPAECVFDVALSGCSQAHR